MNLLQKHLKIIGEGNILIDMGDELRILWKIKNIKKKLLLIYSYGEHKLR